MTSTDKGNSFSNSPVDIWRLRSSLRRSAINNVEDKPINDPAPTYC